MAAILLLFTHAASANEPLALGPVLAQAQSDGGFGDSGVAPPDYLIGPQDTLTIIVRNNADLSQGVVVRPDGRISMPLVEELYVSGLSATELSRKLEEELSVYVQNPQVTVVVTSFAGLFSEQIRVVGEVVQPQGIPFRSGMTLVDVMVATGGLSPYADGNGAVIVRRDGDETRQIPVRLNDLVDQGIGSANVAMEPGDILIIPQGFFSGEWEIVRFVTVRETFTDNVRLEPNGDPALITTVAPGISAFINAARVQAVFEAALPFRYQAINDERFEVDLDLAATSTTVLVPNRAFLDANATVSQETINNANATSVSGDNLVNLDTVGSLFVSPYLISRFENTAVAELRYSVGTFWTSASGVSNAFNNRLALRVNSGPDFSRFSWLTLLSGSYSYRPDTTDVSRADALVEVEYALWRGFSVLGDVGYQLFDDGNSSNRIDEPVWRVGFRWEPSRSTEVEVTYGRSDGEDNVAARATFDITANTTLRGSYREFITTSQSLLINDLRFAGIGEEGDIIDTNTGETFNPNNQPFGIDNQTTRRKVLDTRLSTQIGRNRFQAFGGTQEEEILETGQTEDVVFGGGIWSRRLTPRMDFRIRLEYRETDFDQVIIGRVDEEYTGIARLNYRIFDNFRGFVSYGYRQRDSTDSNEEFTENAVTVGATAEF